MARGNDRAARRRASRQAQEDARARKKLLSHTRKKHAILVGALIAILLGSLAFAPMAYNHTFLAWNRYAYQPVDYTILERSAVIVSTTPLRQKFYLYIGNPVTGEQDRVSVPQHTYLGSRVGETKRFLTRADAPHASVMKLDLRHIAEEDFPPASPHAPLILAWYLALPLAFVWSYRRWR